MQGIWTIFLGRRWINHQRKSNSVWYNTPHWKIIAHSLRTEITKSHLNNRICQHCGVKTSTVTPSVYYVFNIFSSCNINIPSFIGNLWWVLLLGNHLNSWPACSIWSKQDFRPMYALGERNQTISFLAQENIKMPPSKLDSGPFTVVIGPFPSHRLVLKRIFLLIYLLSFRKAKLLNHSKNPCANLKDFVPDTTEETWHWSSR